jgi:hypothetical protein
MTRVRTLFAVGLFVAFGLAAGCGKKPDPTPTPEPDPKPGGVPAAETEKADAVKRLAAIGEAMYEFGFVHGFLPGGIVGPKGERGLSWRVQILPYLGPDEAKLYEQFNLKEPWDSEHNKKLLAKMPKVFESPGKAVEGKTHLRSFAGPSAFLTQPRPSPVLKGKAPPPPFGPFKPGGFVSARTIASIQDGTSNTLAVAEAPEVVEWTKPDDLPFLWMPDSENPPAAPKLGGVFPGGFHGLMCDGSARFFHETLDPKSVAAMISVDGGEMLPKEMTDILFPPAGVPDSLPDAAARKVAVANYQKILRGMRDGDNTVAFFSAGIVGPRRSIGLSWRVAILPFIGEGELFKEFKLAEPWDSEHNKKLIPKMPKVFASPGKTAEKGHTFVRTTQGPGGIIRTLLAPGRQDEMMIDVPANSEPGSVLWGAQDGTADFFYVIEGTILFVEAADAVPWTKPDELYIPKFNDSNRKGDPTGGPKLPPLGGVFADGFHAVSADGRVTFYKTGYPADKLAKRLMGPTGGRMMRPFGELDKIGYSVSMPLPAKSPEEGIKK